MTPDYSRQTLLKEIGSRGQALLGRSSVLVVGAGGLGSPVLQYLAGAGVGKLGIIDADTLESSNLHRQPLYALADVGAPKVDLARVGVTAINPEIRVETFNERLTSVNAVALIGRHDLVIDCSDNFRTKYTINDAAVLTQRPAIFASVYQYEGQLQVYRPAASHACLRCLWPDAMQDGVVGNCAEAGVLGPVPGVFGTLQALLAIKILLDLDGQLAGELLLLDFNNFSSLKLKAPRRAACTAPLCTLIKRLEPDAADIEMNFASLAAAAQEYELLDIRTAAEVAAQPTPARHVPMGELLDNPSVLSAGRKSLLVCASGKRSLAAARELRRRGIVVHSLAGGLQRVGH